MIIKNSISPRYIPTRLKNPVPFYVYTFYNEKCRLLHVINDYISIIKIEKEALGKCMHRKFHWSGSDFPFFSNPQKSLIPGVFIYLSGGFLLSLSLSLFF